MTLRSRRAQSACIHPPHRRPQGELTVKTYNYTQSIVELWTLGYDPRNGKWGDAFYPYVWQGQFAAVAIVLFSCIWPHVKLLALHVTWYSHADDASSPGGGRRTRSAAHRPAPRPALALPSPLPVPLPQ